MVVSVRRTFRPGMFRAGVVVEPVAVEVVLPPRVKPPSAVSSETSAEIFSEMRPSDMTTGVKPRPTP